MGGQSRKQQSDSTWSCSIPQISVVRSSVDSGVASSKKDVYNCIDSSVVRSLLLQPIFEVLNSYTTVNTGSYVHDRIDSTWIQKTNSRQGSLDGN